VRIVWKREAEDARSHQVESKIGFGRTHKHTAMHATIQFSHVDDTAGLSAV
jgi:hypothetical protein